MKRLIGLVLALSIAFILVGCGDDDTTITPPTYQSVLIDGESPVSNGVLQTFYKQKSWKCGNHLSKNQWDQLPYKPFY